MNDEQRAQVVASQRQSMGYGTVIYERGLEIVEKTGWVGCRDMARTASLFPGVGGGGAVTIIIAPEIDEPLIEQTIVEVPFHRVVEMTFAPKLS